MNKYCMGRLVVSLAMVLGCPFPAQSGNLTIAESDGDVVVEANDVSTSEVLSRLAVDYGFGIERIGVSSAQPAVWRQFSGQLPEVITSILHNQSHLIVYSASSSNGIERVVVYGSNCQVPGNSTAPQTPSSLSQPQPRSPILPHPQAQTRSSMGRPVASLSPKPLAKEVIAPHPAATH